MVESWEILFSPYPRFYRAKNSPLVGEERGDLTTKLFWCTVFFKESEKYQFYQPHPYPGIKNQIVSGVARWRWLMMCKFCLSFNMFLDIDSWYIEFSWACAEGQPCICVHVCLCVWKNMYTCVWRPEDSPICHSSGAIHLSFFETGTCPGD